MKGKTFVEKILGAPAGAIVFKKPDIVLTHDNTSSIINTFKKMGGKKVLSPQQLMIVLDHNAPPTNAKLANDYQKIRDFVTEQGINNFHDAGAGICHQIMSDYAKPGMIIVGSDSHTCTAGAFNTLAAGIDRTEAAGLWKQGETWFRVPQTIKINLEGKLPKGVFAKDLSLYIIGKISSSGADYLSIEYHGDGANNLTIEQRMTLCNLASEMGAKNSCFPPDNVLSDFIGEDIQKGIWADNDAEYFQEINIDLSKLCPLIAIPHQVDNVRTVKEMLETPIHQAVVGTCTNGRLEDLRIASKILKGKKLPLNMQMLIIPASRNIYLEAINEGLVEIFIKAGANVLSSSCGPCLGTGQGIPADNFNIISTANRNFKGRMGNKNAFVYLASPAVVATSALNGKISLPECENKEHNYFYKEKKNETITIDNNELRKSNGVWDYSKVNNINTDLMFAGHLTYKVLSSEPKDIIPHLFEDFDPLFAKKAEINDIIIAGDNFGCGSSREHPAVGLAHIGIQAVICKSVNRIFYRSSVNQGLPIIIQPEAVDFFNRGMNIEINFQKGVIKIEKQEFKFAPLPDKILNIFKNKGLINYILNKE
ncbi:MAG: aconitase/3-isopropylmalate dehydratase large subunit family protein [Bacteroidales bacterium]